MVSCWPNCQTATWGGLASFSWRPAETRHPMTTILDTARGPRTARAARPLRARLGEALNRLLDAAGERELICGDADSSLLAIARDLRAEDRALCGHFGR